jgi:hypothetical protein
MMAICFAFAIIGRMPYCGDGELKMLAIAVALSSFGRRNREPFKLGTGALRNAPCCSGGNAWCRMLLSKYHIGGTALVAADFDKKSS